MYFVVKFVNKEGLSIYKYGADTMRHYNFKGKIKAETPDFVIDKSMLLAEVETKEQARYVRDRYAKIDEFLYKNHFSSKTRDDDEQ
jgi:hypothetical protein